jgi:hypothetical protein
VVSGPFKGHAGNVIVGSVVFTNYIKRLMSIPVCYAQTEGVVSGTFERYAFGKFLLCPRLMAVALCRALLTGRSVSGVLWLHTVVLLVPMEMIRKPAVPDLARAILP